MMRSARSGLVALALLAAACTPQAVPAKADMAAVNGVALQLTESDAACFVTWSLSGTTGKRLQLALPPPCQFHRSPSGQINFRGDARRSVILVESLEALGDKTLGCRIRIARIAITQIGVTTSPNIAKVGSCPPFQWEDKMYSGQF